MKLLFIRRSAFCFIAFILLLLLLLLLSSPPSLSYSMIDLCLFCGAVWAALGLYFPVICFVSYVVYRCCLLLLVFVCCAVCVFGHLAIDLVHY